jgi:hypothetical protein
LPKKMVKTLWTNLSPVINRSCMWCYCCTNPSFLSRETQSSCGSSYPSLDICGKTGSNPWWYHVMILRPYANRTQTGVAKSESTTRVLPWGSHSSCTTTLI